LKSLKSNSERTGCDTYSKVTLIVMHHVLLGILSLEFQTQSTQITQINIARRM